MTHYTVFPKRTVHLDFHTGPHIPDVARDFDPKQFAATFKQAHVDSVTVFAKCHHGHLYYQTDHPARHPSLPRQLDLLGEQIEALHSAGILAPIYLSVQCDEFAANAHPEWLAITPELRQVKFVSSPSPFEPGWQIMDMSSPYQDFLADQLSEVLSRFGPVDGIFMDMCWDQISCSKWAIDGMRSKGLRPQDAGDRAAYARLVAHTYMARYKKMVEQSAGGKRSMGIWFNSRPKTNLGAESALVDHIEVEALPTGGWGYAYFPYVSRFVRPLGMETLSHTGRFHLSWGDNGAIKPAAALKYETCQILSQGLSNGVGDLLHPRGVPQEEVYRVIGEAYAHIERCEPFVASAKHVKEAALIVDPNLGDTPGHSGLGAVRALQQRRVQFDILPPQAALDGYALVIIPETTRVDASLAASLKQFLQTGGALLIVGDAITDPHGKPVLDELGIELSGPSPFSHVFLRTPSEVDSTLSRYDTVMYERGLRMKAAAGSEVLCQVIEPYFERAFDHFSGHSYTPPNQASPYAAAVQRGKVISFAVPIFTAFAKYANVPYRQLLGAAIRRLLPEPLILADGPAHLEVTALQRGDTQIVHLISFLPTRLGDGLDLVTDPFPLVEMPLAVRCQRRPKSVWLQPHGKALPFDYRQGYVHLPVTLVEGHGMIVIE